MIESIFVKGKNYDQKPDICGRRCVCRSFAATGAHMGRLCGRSTVAAHVSSRPARRLSFRRLVGARRGDRFACRQFFNYFRHGQPHACGCAFAFHDRGTCDDRRNRRFIFPKNKSKRMDGISRRASRLCRRENIFSPARRDLPKYRALYGGSRMVADHDGASRTRCAGGFGAVFDLGDPLSCRSGQKS